MSILNRISTAEAVVNYIIDQIEEKKLKPGDALLSERVLMNELGISRFSLREGLARLSALGIIDIYQGKGAFVATELNSKSLKQVFLPIFTNSDEDFYKDLFIARRVIEQETSVQAAIKRTEKDLEALHEILQESSDVIDDPEAFGILDFKFHNTIAEISGNIFLQKMLEISHDYMRAFLLIHAKNSKNRQSAYEDHIKIYECIKDKDVNKINKLMITHLEHCKKNYEYLSK